MWEDHIQTAFFKCTNWQLEETLDPSSCRYHYYCNSSYPGNYTPAIDLIVLIFTLLSFSTTIAFMVMEMGHKWQERMRQSRRYLLPSGPVSLPITVLIMAKGFRINTLFPMTTLAPAILQLLRISALAFDNETTSDVKYVFLESSTISGILHSALYLDSIVLPYYTGIDALAMSRMSGECSSCVCREMALKVGGMVVVFRGWSVTTAMVAGSLFLRIVCRVWRENSHKVELIRVVLQNLSWMLIAAESVYLVMIPFPQGRRTWAKHVTYAGVFVLICLQIVTKVCTWIIRLYRTKQIRSGKGSL